MHCSRAWEDLRPDLALVDIRMPPYAHGRRRCTPPAQSASRHPDTAVLLLSQQLEPEIRAPACQGKGPTHVGYLLKERVGRVEQLLDAVRRVSAGECVIDRAVVEELLRLAAARPTRSKSLTPREREILALMAEGRSNQGISRALWL